MCWGEGAVGRLLKVRCSSVWPRLDCSFELFWSCQDAEALQDVCVAVWVCDARLCLLCFVHFHGSLPALHIEAAEGFSMIWVERGRLVVYCLRSLYARCIVVSGSLWPYHNK